MRVVDTPHYSVAEKSIDGDRGGIGRARRRYIEYLESSWPSYGLDVGDAQLVAQYDRYLERISIASGEKSVDAPVLLTRLPGRDDYYVVDGNHRCAIASALGLPVSAKILEFSSVFDQFMGVDMFYGTKNRNMPYQSIYLDKRVIRRGRRDDIYDRLGLLPTDSLKDKTVLDVGSNMGMNSIGTLKSGAKTVVGLEISANMVDAATRFAVFDGCYSGVDFRHFDVDSDVLPRDEKYDIAFILSVHHHLERPSALARIARRHVTEAVIFEGHPRTNFSDYEEFFLASGFSTMEKVAYLGESIFDRTPCRPLWIFRK